MSVYIFSFETQSIKCFFFFLFRTLLVVLRHPNQTCRISSFWLSKLGNHRLTLIFQWKLNKQKCNCERMRDKDVKFIHIISIVTVVYNNGINLKILRIHLETSSNNLQIAPCIVSLANIRIHKQFSSNFNHPTSIRLCTLYFRALQCSMECPRTPPW